MTFKHYLFYFDDTEVKSVSSKKTNIWLTSYKRVLEGRMFEICGFMWRKKPEYLEEITDHGQATTTL